MNGFIKLHRSMLDWEWYDDVPTKVLFLHMLFKANHRAKKWHGIDVQRGQFISGRKRLSEETCLSEQQIRTAISKLKSTREITTQSTKGVTLYTIENYGKYQDKPKEATKQVTTDPTNEQPTINQRVTTTKEYKEVKEGKKEDQSASLFDLFWEAGMRKVNKQKAKTSFTNLLKKQKNPEQFVHHLVSDIQKRKVSGQLGFSEMHPTTYLNGERWTDELLTQETETEQTYDC